MNMMVYFSLFFLLFSAFFLFIAGRILIYKKPVIMNSVVLIGVVTISFLPTIIINILRMHAAHGNFIPSLFVVIVFVGVLVFYGFIIKGYTFYGINDEELRQHLLDALKANNLPFEEKLNKIVLTASDNEINISCQQWMGTGMIRLKNRKDARIFMDVITVFRGSFQNNTAKTPLITPLFYAVFGVIFLVMFVYFIALALKVPAIH